MRDDDLVAGAKRGDEVAWAELYARHGRRLIIWLRAHPQVDAATSAEDIAHDAWLTAAEKIADFRGTADEFAGWLFGIGRHHALNRSRTATRRATDPVAEPPPQGEHRRGVEGDPAGEVLSQGHVRWLLARLSPREAEVVACIDVVGLDVVTTSKALRMSPVAVRVARHRALGRLRRLLADTGDGPVAVPTPLVEATDGP